MNPGPTPSVWVGDAMKFALALIATIMLSGCQRIGVQQCDPTNAPGTNCYTKPGPPYRN